MGKVVQIRISNSTRYSLIRDPVFMEDEGRGDLVGVFYTKNGLMKKLKEETASGYYRESDYTIFVEISYVDLVRIENGKAKQKTPLSGSKVSNRK